MKAILKTGAFITAVLLCTLALNVSNVPVAVYTQSHNATSELPSGVLLSAAVPELPATDPVSSFRSLNNLPSIVFKKPVRGFRGVFKADETAICAFISGYILHYIYSDISFPETEIVFPFHYFW